MSKIKKRIQELRLPRVSQYKPSTVAIMLLLIGLSIFILGGGIYDIMERPLTVLPTSSNPIVFYPGMSDQFLNESLISMLFILMGISGGVLAFRSTRYAYRPRESQMFLLIGLALLIVAFVGTEIVLNLKGL